MTHQEGWDPIPFMSEQEIKNIQKEQIKNNSTVSRFQGKGAVSELSDALKGPLVNFIKNPDPGSDFEKKIQPILDMNLSDEELLGLMFSHGYGLDIRVGTQKDDMISFIAYQKDEREKLFKVFKLFTQEDYRGYRLTYDLVSQLLEDYNNYDVKVGKGLAEAETDKVNKASHRLMQLFGEQAGYEVDMDSFIIHKIES